MRYLLIFLGIALLNACASDSVYPTQDVSPQTQTRNYSVAKQRHTGDCVDLNQSNIDKLKALPLQGRRYLYYCHLCNPKKKPDNPRIIPQIAYTRYDETTWNFNFGYSYPIDAADIYVEGNLNQFLSLSKLINCPVSNIPNEWDMRSKKR